VDVLREAKIPQQVPLSSIGRIFKLYIRPLS
jgi:hypothetical protein